MRHQVSKQLSFALYGAANRLARMHKPMLKPLGLTFPQYLVMLDLLESAPQPVGGIGLRLGMDTGTITPLLKRLERSGLVSRQRDTQDVRRVLVDLTPSGEALRDSVVRVSDQVKAACHLSARDADELRDALDGLGR